jgi:hypothetical protein
MRSECHLRRAQKSREQVKWPLEDGHLAEEFARGQGVLATAHLDRGLPAKDHVEGGGTLPPLEDPVSGSEADRTSTMEEARAFIPVLIIRDFISVRTGHVT